MTVRHASELYPYSAQYSLSRRRVLAGFAALGAAALMPGAALAQLGANGAVKRQIIDVHRHMLPPKYIAKYRRDLISWKWTPKLSLEEMNLTGVRVGIIAAIDPGVWFGNVQEARTLSREFNEYGARMGQDYPGRFGLFGTIPLPDTAGSLKEIEYAMDTLHADGIGLFTDYDGKYLDDPAFAPVMEELNRRQCVVHVHPSRPGCCVNLVPQVPTAIEEYPFDTTRTITSLVYTGTLTRYPKIRFIFSHGGGTIAFLAGRISTVANHNQPKYRTILPNGPMAAIQTLYFDTASVDTKGALDALLALAAPKHILYGTDFPWMTGAVMNRALRVADLNDAVINDIGYQNALVLFPKYNRS